MVKYTVAVALGFLLIASPASAITDGLHGSILDFPQDNHSIHLTKKVTPDNQNYDENSDDEETVVKAKIKHKKSGESSGFKAFFVSLWEKFVSIFS